jgi:acetyltransferase-like isoleucine patch superfamily enzyme
MKKIRELLKCNLMKTIKFNFKMLPFKQAMKLPVLFYGKTDFRSLKGKVEIKGPLSTAMIRVGIKDEYVDTSVGNTIWTINGTIVFNGPLKIWRGTYFVVAKNAVLDIGSKTTKLGSNLKIMCFDRITIGDCVRIAWECQIYDTSFHYLELLNNDHEIKPLSKPIVIGNRVWLGNRSTVSKGAVIPDDTIVASSSMVNKDFSQIEPYSMLAGCPASVKGTGYRRVYDRKQERELDKTFNYPRTGL